MKQIGKRCPVFITAVLLAALITACAGKKETIVIEEDSRAALNADQAEETEEVTLPAHEEAPVVLYVHVCGAVMSEGVYALPEGARIGDALALAGGAKEEADTAAINLAQYLQDGMKIYVPSAEETRGIPKAELAAAYSGGTGTFTDAGAVRININTASLQELMRLNGIGERYAQAIIEYREARGAFQRIEDIKQVHGIGDKTFERIKDFIIV